jgi:hypothetical protein
MASSHALCPLIGKLVNIRSSFLREEMQLFLMDNKPVPVCHPHRHGRVRLLREDEAEILLITAAEKTCKHALKSPLRESVETTFSQLWNCFIDCARSLSRNGLWDTIKLKMLHLNLGLNGIFEA